MKIITKSSLEENLSIDSIFAKLLSARGLNSKEEIKEFLEPPSPNLDLLITKVGIDPNELTKTKNLIDGALKKGEDILVFGDYDADGLTATAVMWQTIQKMAKGKKSRVLPFIPDRRRHGYGLSEKAISDIFDGTAFESSAYPNFSPRLVVTVDNGIVANDEIKLLMDKDVKVIVTDHHQPGDELPNSDSIVHSTVTSGAGVAWIVSLYLLNSSDFSKDLIGIATIGIVADQMPLFGVNRTIAVEGLENLSHTKNLGIKNLCNIAGIANKKITSYDISFVIAPRLNAVGRLKNPMDGLRLLCTSDRSQSAALAEEIHALNVKRQELTQEGIDHALSRAPQHNLMIVSSPDYHEGIIGLIAGRLAEKHNRPSVAVAINDDICKGSARSIPGINVTDLLRNFSDLFHGLGGHEQAAGFSITPDNLEKLEKELPLYADQVIDKSLLVPSIMADMELLLSHTSLELAKNISRLEPFGMGNYKPRFLSRDLHVLEDRKLGSSGIHRKLTVEQNGVVREVIWFKAGEVGEIKEIKQLVYNLDVNVWNGRESLQLVAKYVET